jgi:hypothetical protein
MFVANWGVLSRIYACFIAGTVRAVHAGTQEDTGKGGRVKTPKSSS